MDAYFTEFFSWYGIKLNGYSLITVVKCFYIFYLYFGDACYCDLFAYIAVGTHDVWICNLMLLRYYCFQIIVDTLYAYVYVYKKYNLQCTTLFITYRKGGVMWI